MTNNIEKSLCQLSILQEIINSFHIGDVQQLNESEIFRIEGISQDLNNSLVRFLLNEQRKDGTIRFDETPY